MMQRPYQGYPYVNPTVIDVPTISADVAAKWNNLPRKPIDLNRRKDAQTDNNKPEVRKDSDPVVVYIDLPEDGASSVSERLESSEIDFELVDSSSADSKRGSDAPVVYIDLPVPEANGSDVARTPVSPEEPTFVQDTIYYDQFDNRRIDSSKEVEDSDEESEASHRPARRPNALNLNGAGSSTGFSSSVPPLMTKQTEIYGRPDFDTIPASQFPEPPPAYEEVETTPDQPRAADPPRTQVILPGDQSYQPEPVNSPIGLPNPDRKNLTCQHCGLRVHTLVIRENGFATHATALSCLLLCILPAVLFIYCTDYLKERNHYCPNCNQLIGHQRPIFSSKIYYNPAHIA